MEISIQTWYHYPQESVYFSLVDCKMKLDT